MLADDVAFLLQDFGSDLTITRVVSGVYNPATGQIDNGLTLLVDPDDNALQDAETAALWVLDAFPDGSFNVRGVFINYEDGSVDGTVVQRGDRRLLVAAQGAGDTPAVGDFVEGLRVLDVRTIAPNGVPIAWACQVRK
jgi:hypothetical protein